MSETERLALIARAGKHLRDLGGEMPPPERRRSESEPDQTGIHPPQRSVAHLHPSLHEANTEKTTSPLARQPVRLNFAQLRRRGMLTPDNLKSNLGSEYQSIKRRMLAGLRASRPGVGASNLVMVTSARSAEGKTFTCVNLAISLAAERNVRVLLVDADILRPQLGVMFEPSATAGITDVLDGKAYDIDALTQPCGDLPNLNVVFSGRHDEYPAGIIATPRMAEFCAEISRRYSDGIVLIDTAPVLASAETVALAALMHQILFVVASGQTTRPQLQVALESVAACPNISVILNKAPVWNKPDSDSYYYHGSYDAHNRGHGGESSVPPAGRHQDVH